jgi:membrane-associated protease RseP (regulator of RpoE activity)
MKWFKLILAGVLVVAGASVARAQEEEEQCVCPDVGTHIQVVPGPWALLQQGKLGVWVHSQASPETDRYGALVDNVADGSPAAKAGIKSGDIITKLNGESLLTGGGPYDEQLSAPGQRLVERARALERGDTVRVEYRRAGETKTVQLVAGEFDREPFWVSELTGPASGRLRTLYQHLEAIPEVHVSGPETFALRLGARLPGLELVSLNPDLGAYFGTEEGVLVVSVPEDSKLGLKAGDVIKSIDGRAVRSPSHAMRILRSYEADEEVSFQLFRNKSQTTVRGRIPEMLGMGTAVFDVVRER